MRMGVYGAGVTTREASLRGEGNLEEIGGSVAAANLLFVAQKHTSALERTKMTGCT